MEIQGTKQADTMRVALTLDVTYSRNGVPAGELLDLLRRMCERAIGEGGLTGCSSAEVEEYALDVVQVDAELTEDELADYMIQRIDSGDLALEDIPVRLARYGLMKPAAFVNEMAERMGMKEHDLDAETSAS